MTNLLIMLSIFVRKCAQKHAFKTLSYEQHKNSMAWYQNTGCLLLKLLQLSGEKLNRIYQSRQNSRFHIDNIAFSLTIRHIEISRAHHLLCEQKIKAKKEQQQNTDATYFT